MIAQVTEADLPELLPLMRAYCSFYEAAPREEDLLGLARALLAEPERHGIQLIARDAHARAAGFATVYWTWSTLEARRTGVLNDLFVAEHARGRGLAEELIDGCRRACRAHGVGQLVWSTAPGNRRAQALYERLGAGPPTTWLEYSLAVPETGAATVRSEPSPTHQRKGARARPRPASAGRDPRVRPDDHHLG